MADDQDFEAKAGFVDKEKARLHAQMQEFKGVSEVQSEALAEVGVRESCECVPEGNLDHLVFNLWSETGIKRGSRRNHDPGKLRQYGGML
eukprot:1374988-Amorphochlora_amoeboformis.AAC.1